MFGLTGRTSLSDTATETVTEGDNIRAANNNTVTKYNENITSVIAANLHKIRDDI